MKKFITPTYTFTPGASGVGTVNLSGITGFNVKNLVSIINQTRGVVIYATGSQSLRYTNVVGTTVTLFFNTTGMSSGDVLQVIYEDNSAITVEPILIDKNGKEVPQLATFSGGAAVGNSTNRLSDNFSSPTPSALVWDEVWANKADSFVEKGGNSSGSSYLKISLSPFELNSEYRLISKGTFDIPSALGVSYSASQRFSGQEFSFGFVGCDANGNIEYNPPKADVALPATLSITSNIATITFAAPHNFVGNDRVVLYGNTISALNVGPVFVGVVSQFSISVAIALPNATYNCNGFIKFVDQLDDASNGCFLHTGDTTNASNMTIASRRSGQSVRFASMTTASSNASPQGSSSFTDSFLSNNIIELQASPDDIVAVSRSADSIASPQTPVRFTQGYPDESKKYKIFIKAKNHARLPRPIARIVSATKTGSTVATFVTDVPHNLAVNASRIVINGIRDTLNFPNATTMNVQSVPNATTFTAFIGTTTTGTSAGGYVGLCDANGIIPGVSFPSVQSITRTSNALQITLASNPSALTSGETIHLYGCDAGSMGLYDGAYKVARINGSIVVVDSVGPDIAPTNCGGGILKRTDFRVHMVRLNDFLRHTIEVSSNGSGDSSKGIPVSGVVGVSGAVAVTGTVGVSSISGGTVSVSSGSVTLDGGYIGSIDSPIIIGGGFIDNINNPVEVSGNVDINSNANPLTIFKDNQNYSSSFGGTYTTSSFEYLQAFGGDCITVSANVSTLTGSAYIYVYDSPDQGVTYHYKYTIGPIVQVGVYSSPILSIPSNYIQLHVEPAAGSSITVTTTTVYSNKEPTSIIKFSTKSFNPNTLNSTTPIIDCSSVKDFHISIRNSAQTSPATITVEFSHDQINWWPSPITISTINGTVRVNKANELWSYVRARVTSAGSGITMQDITIKGMAL